MAMKFLTACLLLFAVSAFAANPDYKVFRGAGGITIVSNPPTGTIVIDGSGVAAAGGTNSINVAAGNNITVVTNGTIFTVAVNNASGLTNISPLGIGLPFNPTNSGLIGEGDSLMVNLFPILTNVAGWRQFGAVSNFAESGLVMDGLNNHWTTNTAPAIAAMKNAGYTNIYLAFTILANNIYEPTATFAATMLSWSNYIVRAHASNVTVIAFTILPQYFQENQRILNWNYGNYFIRNSALPDYLIDWARLLPTPSDTTFYTDGVHPNATGNLRTAEEVDATLRGWRKDRVNSTAQAEYNTNLFFVTDGAVVATLNRKGLVVAGTTNNISGDLYLGTDANSRITTLGWVNIAGVNPLSPLQVGGSPDTTYSSLYGNSANFFGVDDGTHSQLGVWSTTASAAGKGARILLGGRNTVGGGITTSPYPYAYIVGAQEGASTTYNGYLAFHTAQTDSALPERMRITSAGNVGIGTTTPAAKFEVAGPLGLPASSGTLATNYVRFRNTGDSQALDIGGSSGTGTPVWLQVHDSSDQSANYGMVLQPNGGSVGIGTLAPVSGSSLTLEGGHLLFKTDNTYDIGASGANRPRNIYAGGGGTFGNDITTIGAVSVGASQKFLFSGNGGLYGNGNGIFELANNGATDFNRLQLGGTTAAFPALGRTNGNLVVFGADGLFGGGGTNSLWLMGGGLIQDFTFTAPRAPERQGAVYWNDGTNVCVVLRNGAGTLTTNKLSMTAWP